MQTILFLVSELLVYKDHMDALMIPGNTGHEELGADGIRCQTVHAGARLGAGISEIQTDVIGYGAGIAGILHG